MLESRIITSVVLVLPVLLAVLLLPSVWLTMLLAGLLLGVGGWEAGTLAGLRATVWRMVWLVALVVLGALAVFLLHRAELVPWLLGAGVVLWLMLPFWLLRPGFGKTRPSGGIEPLKLGLQAMILIAALIAIAWLHVRSPWWVIWLLLIVAAADIGAFFSGRAAGGPKLAPKISPGKTWSGVFGGLATAVFAGYVSSLWFPDVSLSVPQALGLALMLAAWSVCGDLLFSLLKRHRGLKDTSSLLPGHGGLLDRIDGLVAAAPACALVAWWISA